ncbi:MAG: DUF1573 domain-containing protein [Thermodesulfobacteriota bacterium]
MNGIFSSGKPKWGLLLLCLVTLGYAAVLGLWPLKGLAASGSPKAVLSETAYDFGEVYEDRHLEHTFVIKNTGPGTLEILEVDPDCACTVFDYDRRIPPGGEGKITLGIKPYSVIHPFQKKTKVRFNDPGQPEVVLVLKGKARPMIEIQPSHIVRLRGSVGQDLRGQVRFTSNLPFPLEITKYQTNVGDKIEVHLHAEVPGKVYVLEVRNKSREAGHYAGKIDLFTNSQQRPRLLVRVFGDLYSESLGSP